MKLVKELNLPFYLTGGTALSRFYYNHRYSDDLDFFINNDNNFHNYFKTFLSYIQQYPDKFNFHLSIERTSITSNSVRTFLIQEDVELKVDFINDIAAYFGEIHINPDFGRIDNWRNILSNKISAIYRYEVKDYVDIWVIAKNNKFNWQEIIYEAKQKEISVEPVQVFELFKSFPFDKINIIKWRNKPDISVIQNDFNIIANDILEGKNNSLSI